MNHGTSTAPFLGLFLLGVLVLDEEMEM